MTAKIAGRPVTHSLEPWGRLKKESSTGGRNELGILQTLVPFSRSTPSSFTITFLSFSSLCAFSVHLSAGDKILLVGCLELQANGQHTFNASKASHCARGPIAVLSDRIRSRVVPVINVHCIGSSRRRKSHLQWLSKVYRALFKLTDICDVKEII